MSKFDYLDYKNKIPLHKVVLGKIPKISPYSVKYKNYWRECKRKIIEGYWVSHEGDYQWVPPVLALYNNFWTIEMSREGSKSQNKIKGTPRLRDIEWIKGFVWAVARGFSGFELEDRYSSNRLLLLEEEELNDYLEYAEPHILESIYNSKGELKEYIPALEYLYKYKDKNLGKPHFYNPALNVADIECRNIGKSFISSAMVGQNFLTDGSNDYDELLELMKEGETPMSETLVGAIDSKYSTGLINKLKLGLDSLPGMVEIGNDVFPSPLSKKYTGSFVSGKHIISEYDKKIGNNWTKAGSKSRILHRSFADNPFAANGTRPGFLVIDEIGFMGNLLESLGQLAECTTQDGRKFGTIWMTGTGGDMESGATQAIMKVFYSPETYSCLEFDDIFEDKGKIGFFVPAWMALDEFRDELGNVNKEAALRKLMREREAANNSKSKQALYSLLQMKPLVPSEAFLVLEGNIFPVGELKEHLAYLESSKRTQSLGNSGWMMRSADGTAYFKVDHELIPATYPTIDSEDEKGAVVIWEEPIPNPPYGAYVAGIDPYDQDKATSSVSFGSIFIYKRFISADQTYHLPVAEYTGRPDFANDFYEQCRRLLEYYNCKALYENQNPGLKKYFDTKFCTHLLHAQPNIIKQISPNSKVNRGYGIHMPKAIKDELEIMTRDWLKTELDEGIMQLTKIYSIPLLKELIAYNDTGNFDRVIAFMLCILQDTEMHKIKVAEVVDESNIDNFFNRKFFTNDITKVKHMTSEEFITKLYNDLEL